MICLEIVEEEDLRIGSLSGDETLDFFFIACWWLWGERFSVYGKRFIGKWKSVAACKSRGREGGESKIRQAGVTCAS